MVIVTGHLLTAGEEAEEVFLSFLLSSFLLLLFFFFFFFFFWSFLGLHMEFPRLGVELELQLPTYTTAIATPNP